MAFTSVEFALFCLIGVAVYYLMPKATRWIVLLALSYIFYLAGGVGMGAYLLFTTITTYISSRLIGSVKTPDRDASKEDKAKAKNRKRLYGTCCMVLNFGLLYFVKYWNFTLDFLHIPGSVLRFNILLPLGISFYIFQSMGYIIDLIRGKYEPEKISSGLHFSHHFSRRSHKVRLADLMSYHHSFSVQTTFRLII